MKTYAIDQLIQVVGSKDVLELCRANMNGDAYVLRLIH
jgi:hypothetical protein